MNQDSANLLEIDGLEEVLEVPNLPQSVVVVQYRTARLPWLLVIVLILVMPFVGLLIYQRVFDQIRAQAAFEARRELERWQEQNGFEDDRPAPTSAKSPMLSTPNSGSANKVRRDEGPALGSSTGQPASGTPNATAIALKASNSEVEGRPSSVEATPSRTIAVVDSPTNALSPAPSAGEFPAIATSLPIALLSPFDQLRPESTAPARDHLEVPAPIAEPSAESASTRPGSDSQGSPNSSVNNKREIARTPPLAVSPVVGVEIVPAQGEPLLPSRAETLRQIEEEASQKEAELAGQQDERQAERRRLRHEERIRFHEELRQAVNQSGERARVSIDQLCNRFKYESDPVSLARAQRAWRMTKPLAYRVRALRSLDLPETLILNFLSDDLHTRLRSRDGLRNINEVRVKAAELLLKCELPPD